MAFLNHARLLETAGAEADVYPVHFQPHFFQSWWHQEYHYVWAPGISLFHFYGRSEGALVHAYSFLFMEPLDQLWFRHFWRNIKPGAPKDPSPVAVFFCVNIRWYEDLAWHMRLCFEYLFSTYKVLKVEEFYTPPKNPSRVTIFSCVHLQWYEHHTCVSHSWIWFCSGELFLIHKILKVKNSIPFPPRIHRQSLVFYVYIYYGMGIESHMPNMVMFRRTVLDL